LIDKLKSFDPLLKIIILSSYVERKRILHLINSGLYGYLMKPINVNELLTQLEKVAALVYEKKILLFYIDTLEKSLRTESFKKNSVTSTSDTHSENGLLVFDNTRRDEAIHRMHYKDDDKISAYSFFEQELMDEATIEDILFYSKELEGIFLYGALTQEYLSKTANFIAVFANDLECSGEFRDIAYALRGLSVTLSELIEKHDFSQNASKMIKTIIDSIIEDLVSWTQHVLIDKDAVDIHYLDASLLANIAQLGLSIKNISHKESHEEELEFF
jgi:predicted amino acid-binding ACT domain protein